MERNTRRKVLLVVFISETGSFPSTSPLLTGSSRARPGYPSFFPSSLSFPSFWFSSAPLSRLPLSICEPPRGSRVVRGHREEGLGPRLPPLRKSPPSAMTHQKHGGMGSEGKMSGAVLRFIVRPSEDFHAREECGEDFYFRPFSRMFQLPHF